MTPAGEFKNSKRFKKWFAPAEAVGTLAAMKTKLKARRMWAVPDEAGCYGFHSLSCYKHSIRPSIPVAVIPLHPPTALGDSMVSALTSLGVLRKKGRK